MAGWIAPPEGPLSPPKTAWSFHSPKTPDESTWGFPLRRTLTLTNGFRHATKNCTPKAPIGTISEMCCVKNTQSGGTSPPQLSRGKRSLLLLPINVLLAGRRHEVRVASTRWSHASAGMSGRSETTAGR